MSTYRDNPGAGVRGNEPCGAGWLGLDAGKAWV